MQGNLAVRTRSKNMPALLEFASDLFEVVELTVDDQVQPFVLVREWLIARCQINDAQTSMSKSDASVGCEPLPLPVWPAVCQPLSCDLQDLGVGTLAGEEC